MSDLTALKTLFENIPATKSEHGQIGPMTLDEMVEEYRTGLQATIDYYGDEALNSVHAVFLEGTNIKLCYTGISPKSPNTARFYTEIFNSFPELITKIQTLEAQVKSLVGVIEGGTQAIDALRIYVSPETEQVLYGIMSCFDKALSTLPQLEQYRRERKVIEAARVYTKQFKTNGLLYPACMTAHEELLSKVEALQEKA